MIELFRDFDELAKVYSAYLYHRLTSENQFVSHRLAQQVRSTIKEGLFQFYLFEDLFSEKEQERGRKGLIMKEFRYGMFYHELDYYYHRYYYRSHFHRNGLFKRSSFRGFHYLMDFSRECEFHYLDDKDIDKLKETPAITDEELEGIRWRVFVDKILRQYDEPYTWDIGAWDRKGSGSLVGRTVAEDIEIVLDKLCRQCGIPRLEDWLEGDFINNLDKLLDKLDNLPPATPTSRFVLTAEQKQILKDLLTLMKELFPRYREEWIRRRREERELFDREPNED